MQHHPTSSGAQQLTRSQRLRALLVRYASLLFGLGMIATLSLATSDYLELARQRTEAPTWLHMRVGVVVAVLTLAILLVSVLLHRYQSKLIAARERAEADAHARSQFLAMMSHEIRTPMNGVVGMIDLLGTTKLSEEQSALTAGLRDSAEQLLLIINDVLDLSKLDSPDIELERIELDPAAIAHAAIEAARPAARAKGLALTFAQAMEVPGGLIGDPARFRQILANLISNAIKFTEHGWVHVRLVSAEPVASSSVRLRIEVADTGIGIAGDAKERLFREFSQVDSSISRRFGGTGLGLAICKRLVARMGGAIGVDSEPGHGSTFSFTVVLQRANDATQPAEVEPRFVMTDAPARRLRILVAEDNLTNQTVARRMLEKLGHTCVIVDRGEAAVEHALSGAYDLVFMDMMMPDVDGLTATRRIRALETDAQPVYIVALTANAFKQDELACRSAGMNDFVAKPATLAKLRDAIARFRSSDHVDDDAGHAEGPAFTEAPLHDLASEIGEEGAADVLKIFLNDAADRVRAIKDRLGGDRAMLVNEAHALKSSAAMLGFVQLSGIARQIERSGMAADWPALEQLVISLEAAWERATADAAVLSHPAPRVAVAAADAA